MYGNYDLPFKDLRGLIWWIKKYIGPEYKYEKFVNIRLAGFSYIFEALDPDNRINTVKSSNTGYSRYVLLENDKVLKLTVQKKLDKLDEDIGSIFYITQELFSNAKDLFIQIEYDEVGRRFVSIMDEYGRRISDSDEKLSKFYPIKLPLRIPLTDVLTPVTIEELDQKFKKIIEENYHPEKDGPQKSL